MAKRRIFLAGPRREIPSEQDWPILPAPMVMQCWRDLSQIKTHQVIRERSIEGPNVRDRVTCVLCSPLTLSGSPNECWLHTCHVCVIAPWRLGVWAPIFAHNDRSTCNFKSNWYSELLFFLPLLSTFKNEVREQT